MDEKKVEELMNRELREVYENSRKIFDEEIEKQARVVDSHFLKKILETIAKRDIPVLYITKKDGITNIFFGNSLDMKNDSFYLQTFELKAVLRIVPLEQKEENDEYLYGISLHSPGAFDAVMRVIIHDLLNEEHDFFESIAFENHKIDDITDDPEKKLVILTIGNTILKFSFDPKVPLKERIAIIN